MIPTAQSSQPPDSLSTSYSAASAARELSARGVTISASTILNACRAGRIAGATLHVLGDGQSRWSIPADSLPSIATMRRGRKKLSGEKA